MPGSGRPLGETLDAGANRHPAYPGHLKKPGTTEFDNPPSPAENTRQFQADRAILRERALSRKGISYCSPIPAHSGSGNLDTRMTIRERTAETPSGGSDLPASGDQARRFAARWGAIALIVCAVEAAYADSLHGAFILDDLGSIVDSVSIRRLWPPPDIFYLRSGNESGLHNRPVVNLSWALNYAVGGLDPTFYHFPNLAIHILAALVEPEVVE